MGKKVRPDYERQFDPDSGCQLSKKAAIRILNSIWQEYNDRFLSEQKIRNLQKLSRIDPTQTIVINPIITPEGFAASKNEKSIHFLRREIYALGLTLKRNPPETWTVAELVKDTRGSDTTHPKKLESVFHALFLTAYKDDEGLSRQARWTLGKEAEYCYRHQVEPELLCGFLYQSGSGAELTKKLESDYEEPAFRHKLAVYRQEHAIPDDNEGDENDGDDDRGST